jgi:O-antigen/teichoic acid export membrane protein
MGLVIRQSIKSTLISYIGVILGAFNNLWLYPKYLEPEKIGLLKLLQDIPFLFALFVQLGASSLTDRFFHHFKDGKKNKGFFLILMLYPFIGYSLFIAFFFIFNDYWKSKFTANASLLVDYFIYLIPLTFFMMYISIMEAYLRANLNVNWSNFVRDILIRTFYCIIVFIYAMKIISFNGLIFMVVAVYGIALFMLFIYAKRINILHISKIVWPTKILLKEISIYLLFLIPGTAGSLIAQKIDTIMLATIGGNNNFHENITNKNIALHNIAIYSMAYFISSVIEIPRRSISQISLPILSIAFKENDFSKINVLYKKNSITQLITGCFVFLLIWINIDDLFFFVPDSKIYSQGKYVILFIGLSKLFDMATSINGEIIQFSKYFKFNLVAILLLAILTISLNYIFIPLYQITGAAIALSITIFFFNAVKTYFIWYKMKLLPFTKDMIPLVILSCLIIILPLLFQYTADSSFSSFIFIMFRSCFFCFTFFFLVRKLKISEDANKLIDKTLVIVSKKIGVSWLKRL